MSIPPARISEVPRPSRNPDYIAVAAAGLVLIMASVAVGVFLGFEAGDLFAQDAAARAADTETQGTLAAFAAWNRPLALAGAGLLMTAVVLILRTIIATLRMRGQVVASSLPALLASGRRS